MAFTEIVVIDGTVVGLDDAVLPLTDQGVVRGDGAFETVGVYDGRPFRLEDHLARLAATLEAGALPAVDTGRLAVDVRDALDRSGAGDDGGVDAMVRIYLTGSGRQVLLVSRPPDRPPHRRLDPLTAPWIRPVGQWALAGAKTMSYMPNVVLSRLAQQAGADDALLLSLEGAVLEGPTFGVTWLADATLHVPDPALGIVDSISRRTVAELAAELGLAVRTGAWPLDDVLAADAVLTSSAVRPLRALERVGDHVLPEPPPVVGTLAAALDRRRRT